jgi:signal transduction histidine kinase
MSPQWTLKQRVVMLCVVVITGISLLAAGATMTAVANRGQLDNLLNSIGPMRTASSNLFQALLDQEIGMRGYVLRGAEADLAPYTLGLSAEREATAAIEASEAANQEIKDRLHTVTRLAEGWRQAVAEPAIARVRADGPAAAQAFLAGEAPVRFQAVRDAVTALQASMQAVRDESVAAIRSSGAILLTVLLIAATLVILGGLALMVMLQRTVTRPVTDLAAQVRYVAAGNYEQEIATSGSPELTTLARDVDGLRRQIAADLAEVRQARALTEEAYAQLELQTAELTRSNRDLEQFAYVASHDLQEPLRKVASFCQLLQRRYAGQLDERADQYIAFAVNGAQRMQRLINDLLVFSRIGRATSGFSDVDLNRLAADVAGQLDGTTDPVPELTWSDLPVVHGEEQLLATLLGNLVTNSVKFRRADQPAKVHLSARRLGDSYEISCVDNGIGIEPEFAEKVFVIFQRLHARDSYPGTGIGLAIAKKIVEYHGGTIWIDTDHKGGTAIRFTLPVPSIEPSPDGGVGPTPGGYSSTEHAPDPNQPVRAEEPVS